VNEFWVCAHCKSLNRAGSGRCYSCKQRYGSQPAVPAVSRSSGNPQAAPAAPPAPRWRGVPGAPPPGFAAPPGSQGIVGPGGVPVDTSLDAELPAYLSRPIAGPQLTSANMSFTAAAQDRQRMGPASRLESRISGWLASRQSVSVWLVGYASAVLLALVVLVGAIMLLVVMPAIRHVVETGSVTTAWGDMDSGSRSTLVLLGEVLAVVGILALVFFSGFVGLSTHNSIGLGAQSPVLSPGQAAACWLMAIWAQVKLALGLLAPTWLFLAGYPIIALIVALVAVELAQRSLDDPFGWLMKPARHMPDLFARMALDGTGGTLLGTAWKWCFIAANCLAVAAYALPLAAITARALTTAAGRPELVNWHTGGLGPVQLAFIAVVMPLILTAAFALGLLVPICIDLVERQRTRRTLARVGGSRSWLNPPGGYAGQGRETTLGAQRQPAYDRGPVRYDSDDYDRGSDAGYGADQASLNSPSTTSSPWDDELSDFPPR
jgi:hypothetical protein